MKYILLIHEDSLLNNSGFISELSIEPNPAYLVWTNEKESLMLKERLRGLKVTDRIKSYTSTKTKILIVLVKSQADWKTK